MSWTKTDELIGNWDKDPDATLDYQFNWADWLSAGETIVNSTFTVDDGITVEDSSASTTTATVWLSGGTVGKRYLVTNHIVTSQQRTDDRSGQVLVIQR